MVQLTDELVSLLDEEAGSRGLSRSAIVREALERHLAGSRERLLDRRIVEGYRRIPQAKPDRWGALPTMGDQATAELLGRLDAEESREQVTAW